MSAGDFSVTPFNITVIAQDTVGSTTYGGQQGYSYLVVPATSKYVPDTTGNSAWTQYSSTSTAIKLKDATQTSPSTTLEPNTAYDVYVKNDSDEISKQATITTAKVDITSLTAANVFIKDTVSSDYKTTFDGSAQEPAVTKVALDITGNGSPDDLTVANSKINGLDFAYTNNTNAGTATITITPKEGSIFTGKATVTFTIDKLELTKDNSRVTIGNKVSRQDDVYNTVFDGLQKNPTIKVEAKLKGEWKTLTQDTDYTVAYTKNSGDASLTDGYNVDAGHVEITLAAAGNYTSNVAANVPTNSIPNDGFTIIQAKPAAPSAPVVASTTDKTITIDVSGEELQYTYLYAVTDKNDPSNIKWDGDGVVPSDARTATVVESGANAKATITLSSLYNVSTQNSLVAGTTYYVFSRIQGDSNVVESNVSSVAIATTQEPALADQIQSVVVGVDGKSDTVNTVMTYAHAGTASHGAANETNYSTILGKEYDGKDAADAKITVTLKSNTTYGKYTVEYRRADGTLDRKNAGRVYIWLVAGANSGFSGEVCIGYYDITAKPVKADLTIVDRDYNGTTTVDLNAVVSSDQIIAGDEVTIAGLKGTVKSADAGTATLNTAADLITSGVTITGNNHTNYSVSYNVKEITGTIKKADLQITVPETIYLESFETLELKDYVKANIGSAADLRYSLNIQTKYADTISVGETSSELKFESGKGYDDVKNAGLITVTVRCDVKATDNYTISDAERVKTITIVPVKAQSHLEFSYKDTNTATTPWRNAKNVAITAWESGASLVVPSQTRPDVIKSFVENGSTGNKAYIISKIDGATTTKNYDAFTRGDSGLLVSQDDLVYEYYYADGTKFAANMIPSKDGVYTVKVKINESALAGSDYTKDQVIVGDYVLETLTLYIGCDSSNYTEIADSSSSTGTNRSYYIEEGKLYNPDDDLVRSDFATVDGKVYYADKNGVVIKGRIFTAKGTGKRYYAMKTGEIRMGGIYNTAKGGKVYAYADGHLLVNASKTVNGVRYVADENGRLVKNGFTTTAKGYKYYLKGYKVVTNKKFTYSNGYTYIATKSGKIAMGNKTVSFGGKLYYVRAKGAVAKNTTVSYNGKTYVAGKTGVLKLKK
jgi:hypothetical protein